MARAWSVGRCVFGGREGRWRADDRSSSCVVGTGGVTANGWLVGRRAWGEREGRRRAAVRCRRSCWRLLGSLCLLVHPSCSRDRPPPPVVFAPSGFLLIRCVCRVACAPADVQHARSAILDCSRGAMCTLWVPLQPLFKPACIAALLFVRLLSEDAECLACASFVLFIAPKQPHTETRVAGVEEHSKFTETRRSTTRPAGFGYSEFLFTGNNEALRRGGMRAAPRGAGCGWCGG